MKEFRIYGSSDDLIEIEGDFREELYLSSGDKDEILLVGSTGKLKIKVEYDGCWSFGLCLVDEDIPFPDWNISISTHENGYSTLTSIDVPDNTTFHKITKKEE